MNLYQQSGSSNLIGWQLQVGMESNLFSTTRVTNKMNQMERNIIKSALWFLYKLWSGLKYMYIDTDLDGGCCYAVVICNHSSQHLGIVRPIIFAQQSLTRSLTLQEQIASKILALCPLAPHCRGNTKVKSPTGIHHLPQSENMDLHSIQNVSFGNRLN